LITSNPIEDLTDSSLLQLPESTSAIDRVIARGCILCRIPVLPCKNMTSKREYRVCLFLLAIWLVQWKNTNNVVMLPYYYLGGSFIAENNISQVLDKFNGSTNNTAVGSSEPFPEMLKSGYQSEHNITKDNENNYGIHKHESMLQLSEDRAAKGRNLGNITILYSMEGTWKVRDVNETISGEEYLVRIEKSNGGSARTKESVEHEARKMFKDRLNSSMPIHIDRIYYINLDHRYVKRAIMESWLSKQDIPFSRVAAKSGQNDTCIEKKQGPPCIGISGLAQTHVFIMDQLETNGITLVVEDDFVIQDMAKLLASVHLVPPDWDVLRWDCWDKPLTHFPRYPFSFQLAPIPDDMCKSKKIKNCWFCGGTHVMMWKGGQTIEKLRNLWGTRPHNDIDCLLKDDPTIKSYCIQVGVGEFHFPYVEPSDIPKIEN
jgi:hypothetical protein